MKRFLIKKIIVVSHSEKASFESTFTTGLNILIGDNKTGKSSIIKSIFHTLGCESYIEKSWKDLIDIYILHFGYGEENFLLIRKNNRYIFYRFFEYENKYELIINTDSHKLYSEYLVKEIFGIDAELLTVNKTTSVFTPALLFRFQYIDQDNGWIKLGESFTNMKYLKDWNNSSVKFIIGYQSYEYYKAKKNVDLVKNEISDLKIKQSHYSEIYENINQTIKESNVLSENLKVDELEKDIKMILDAKSFNKRKIISIDNEISNLKNEIYEIILKMKFLEKSIKELNNDFSFAIGENEELRCPTCGMTYRNTIIERIELINDVQAGAELISSYRQDIKNLEDLLLNKNSEKTLIKRDIINLNLKLKNIKAKINIIDIYKAEGRNEIITLNQKEIEKLENVLIEKEMLKNKYYENVKNLESRKRLNLIKKEFKKIYEDVLSKVNINSEYIKLLNFMQKLDNTGSERPRAILSYHLALYLYNLSKGENLYNWLIIDTPNQQGQDKKNLKNIDLLMKLVLTEKGQVILGTEREIGIEKEAKKIIKLTTYKKCLINENYEKHCELLNRLGVLEGNKS